MRKFCLTQGCSAQERRKTQISKTKGREEQERKERNGPSAPQAAPTVSPEPCVEHPKQPASSGVNPLPQPDSTFSSVSFHPPESWSWLRMGLKQDMDPLILAAWGKPSAAG